MRVSTNQFTDDAVFFLNAQLSRLQKLQEQLSSGKRINRPSDDPVGAAAVSDLRTQLAQAVQYERNVDGSITFLEATDAALGSASDQLRKAREVALRGASDTLSDNDRRSLATELDDLSASLLHVANTNFGGRYIFGGTETTQPPFAPDENGTSPVRYNGNGESLHRQISQAAQVSIGVPGSVVFNVGNGLRAVPDAPDVFAELRQLKEAILEDRATEVSDVHLRRLDVLADNLQQQRGLVGARSEQLRSVKARLGNLSGMLTAALAAVEEVDATQAIVQLQTQQTAYQAALYSTAKVGQVSLLDYLR